MAEIGRYIYGVINSTSTLKSFGGIYTVSYRDVSTVVRDSETIDYLHLSKDTLMMHLLKHQEVIEWVMAEHTIIPMRFGTFANNDEELKEILTKGYRTIKDIFERIKGSIEIDILATWSNLDSVLKEVSEEKDVRELKQVFLNKKEGITVDDQMEIGTLIKDYLGRKGERYADEIQGALKGVAQDFKTHDLIDDRMIINTAFLLGKDRVKDFYKSVEELNTRFAEKLNFRCVGPLPPYSFYTLEVKKMDFKEVDWARRRLGLDDTATMKEIKKAYHTRASSSHPDKNPDRPDIEREFDEVTKAYKVILDYCQDECPSFKEDDFRRNSLIVKVRG